MAELDKVIEEQKIETDANGNKIVSIKKTIICSVCGHPNPITASQCKMCSNILNLERKEEK